MPPFLRSLPQASRTLVRISAFGLLFSCLLFSIHAVTSPRIILTNSDSNLSTRNRPLSGRRLEPTNTLIPNLAKTYVISLPKRQERRTQMELLRARLGLRDDWMYLDATDLASPRIPYLLGFIEKTRTALLPFTPFELPSDADVDKQARSMPSLEMPDYAAHGHAFNASGRAEPLTCMWEDNTVADPSKGIPEWMFFTDARATCWDSHLQAVHRLANELRDGEAGLIMEDDVDMERDVREEMKGLMSLVPRNWDMILLGHCFSDESRFSHTALRLPSSQHALYKSNNPKCLHAYLLSRKGARKLFTYLTYELFAFSRSIDQATGLLCAWDKLEAWSVVPSIAVQTKKYASDIDRAEEVNWKDELRDGVLQGSGGIEPMMVPFNHADD